MSQDSTLNIQAMSPQEIDARERSFADQRDWQGWISFTRLIASSQSDQERSRAAWRRLVRRFEELAEEARAENPVLSSDLFFFCGLIWTQELGRDDQAMKAFVGAYRIDAENIEALQEARSLYEKHGEWKLARQLCALELDLLETPNEKAALLIHMAELSASQLNEREDAVRCIKEAAKLIPNFEPPEHFKRLLDEAMGSQRTELDRLLSDAENSKNSRHRARCYFEAAELLMEVDPQDHRIEGWLNACIEVDKRNEQAKNTLQTFYQLNERWADLQNFLTDRLEATQRRSDRVDILKTLAHVSEHALQDLEQSVKWHREVLILNAADDESITFCVKYYNETEQWLELVTVYDAALRMRRRGEDEGEMLFQIAMILWRKVEDFSEAEKYFKRIKLTDPRNPLMLNFYIDFYRQQEDWRKLLNALLAKQGAQEEDEARLEIGIEMAKVAEEKLRNRDKAIEIWRSVLKIDERHEESLSALDRLYRDSGKWSALAELIKAQLDMLDEGHADQKISHLRNLVEIYDQHMRQPTMVTSCYHQILEIDANDEASLIALEGIYRQTSHWSDLSDVIERRASILLQRNEHQVLRSCYQELAELNRDRLNRVGQAIYFYEEMLDISEDLDALIPVIELYRNSEDWSALLNSYQRQVLHLEGEEQLKLYEEMAKLADQQLAQYDEAIELWSKVIEAYPERNDVWEALSDLYPKVQRWHDLSDHLSRRVERLTEENAPLEDRLSWLKRRAQLLADQLDDSTGATELWWDILTLSPQDQDAEAILRTQSLENRDWASLERIYKLRGDATGLVQHFTTLTDAMESVEDRVKLLKRAAKASVELLEDEDRALSTYEHILKEAPEDVETAEALSPIYRNRAQWDRLVDMLEVRFDHIDEPSEALLFELAKTYEQNLSRLPEAFRYLIRGLELHTENPVWLEECERLVQLTMEVSEGEKETTPSYETTQLISTLDSLLERRQDLVEEVRIDEESGEPLDTTNQRMMWSLGRLYEEVLADFDEAIVCYENYRRLTGENLRVLTPLERLYENQQQWTKLLDVMIVNLNRTDSLERQCALHAKIAAVYEQQLNDYDEAEDSYKKLLELSPTSFAAIRGLQRIAEQRQDQDQLAFYIDTELQLCSSSADLANLYYRLGEIKYHSEGEEAALEHLRDALSQEALHEDSVRLLENFLGGEFAAEVAQLMEPFVRDRQEYDLLTRILEAKIEVVDHASEAIEYLKELVVLFEGPVGNLEKAFDVTLKLMTYCPQMPQYLETLERLADALDRWGELSSHLSDLSYEGSLVDEVLTDYVAEEATEEATEESYDESLNWQARIARRLAWLYEVQLSDLHSARDTYEKICQIEGDSLQVLHELDRVNTTLEDWHVLADVRGRIVAKMDDPAAQIEVLYRLATLWVNQLESPNDAIDVYRKVISLDQGNEFAYERLEGLMRELALWDDLAELFKGRLLGLEQEDAQQIAQQIGYQLAELQITHLDQTEEALNQLEIVLAIGTHEPSIKLLEGLLKTLYDGSDESRLYRSLACDLLEPIYQANEDHKGTLRQLSVRLEDALEREDRVRLHMSIAHHLEHYGKGGETPDPVAAFEQFAHGFKEDFGNKQLLTELKRLAEANDLWKEFAEHVKKGAIEGVDADHDIREAMLKLAAQFYDEKLQDPLESITLYQLILAENPEERFTLSELTRLYEATENYESLAEILNQQLECYENDEPLSALGRPAESQIESSEDVDSSENIETSENIESSEDVELSENIETSENSQENQEWVENKVSTEEGARLSLAYQLAQLYEDRLGDHERAIDVYDLIRHEISPSDGRAYVALERLLVRKGDYHRFVESCLDQVEHLTSVEMKLERLAQAARTYEEQLELPDEAIVALQKAQALKEDDEHILSELSRIYGQLDRFEEQLEIIGQQQVISEDQARIDQFELQKALIYKDRLMDPSEALAALQRLLASQPDSAEATSALEDLLELPEVRLAVSETLAPIYERGERWGDLVAVLHSSLEDRSDLDEQIATLLRLAQVEEIQLESPELAFKSIARAYQMSRCEESIEVELERLAILSNLHADLAQLMGEVVTENPDREVSIRLKIASLSEEYLEDLETAISAYREVLHQEPEHVGALGALERLLQRTEDFVGLVDVLEQWLDITEDLNDRTALFERIARRHEESIGASDEAIMVWRRLIEEDEANEKALYELERLLMSTEAYSELAAHYEHWLEQVESAEERTPIQFKLAQVFERHLADGSTAVDLYREIFEVSPRHQETFEALSALFSDRQRVEEIGAELRMITQILEPLVREKENYAELVEILDVLQDGEMDPLVRAQYLIEISSLREHQLEDKMGAFEARLTALKLHPEDQDNRLALQTLAHSTQGYEALAEALEFAAMEVLDYDLKSKLLLELGKIYETFLEQLDIAGRHYHEVLTLQPGDEEAVRALEALYARQHRFQDLVDLYISLAEAAEGDEAQIKRYFQACNTLQNLDQPEQLIQTYRKILDIDETNHRAFGELERLFKLTEDWLELTELLLERIERLEKGTDRARIRHQLAEIYEQNLMQVDDALEAWRMLLEEEDANFEQAYASLERIAHEWRPLGDSEPRRQQIAELLEPLYHERNMWNEWLVTQEDLVELEMDPLSKSERLIGMAKIHEEMLNDTSEAFINYSRAFKHNFGDESLQSELDRLVESTGQWDALITTYRSGLPECTDPELAEKLWSKVARIYEQQGQIDHAIEAHIEAYHLDEMALAPLKELERIYTQTQRFGDLVHTLTKQAHLAEELAEKKALFTRAARLYVEALAQPDEAIELYRTILMEDPEDATAAGELEEIFFKLERWQELVDLLQDQLNYLEDEEAQVATHHEIARIYGQQLQQMEEALMSLRQVLEIQPLNELALKLLKAAYSQTRSWSELLELLEGERSHYDDEQSEAITLDIQMATLYSTQMGDVTRAIELHRGAIERDPQRTDAIRSLEAFMAVAESRLDASEALKEHYFKLEDHASLSRVYQARLSVLDDPSERLDTLKLLGALQRGALSSPKEAFQTYVSALKEDLHDEESLSALQSIGGEESMYEALASAYQELVPIDPQSEVAVKMLRAQAKLYNHRLGNPHAAIQSWSLLRETEPDDTEALKALTKLYEQESLWQELILILEARVDLESDHYALRVQLGDLLESVMQDSAGAIEQWRQVLLDFPEVEEAQAALEARFHLVDHLEEMEQLLEPIYRDQGKWQKLIDLNEALLSQGVVQDPMRREELYSESGELLRDHLNDPHGALVYFQEAFKLNPTDQEVRDRFLSSVDQLEAWEVGRDTLLMTVVTISDPELIVQDHLRIAGWQEERFAQPEQAIQSYQNALAVEPQSSIALEALERLHRSLNQGEALADILRKRAEATYDDQERTVKLHELARVLWESLKRADESARVYEELLMINDQEALYYQSLKEIYQAEGREQALVDLLEREVDTRHLSGVEASSALAQAATLLSHSGELHRALDLYRQAREHEPHSVELRQALENLCTQLEEWDGLKELMDERLKTSQGAEKQKVTLELARLCLDRLMMPDDAFEYYELVLKEEPGHREAFTAARKILLEQMRTEERAKMTARYLDHAQDLKANEAIDFHLEVAELAIEERDQALAIKHLNSVLDNDQAHPRALMTLAKLHEEEGEWEEATKRLSSALEVAAAGPERGEAYKRLGLIYLNELEQLAKAKDALQRAAQELIDAPILEALARIAREEEDDTALFEILGQLAPLQNDQARVRTYLDLAVVAERRHDQAAQLQALESARDLSPEQAKVIEPLVDLYILMNRLTEATPLIKTLIEQLEAKRKKKPLSRALYRLGQLSEALDHPSEALDAYERARKEDPTFASNLVAYSTLLVSQGRGQEAQDTLKALLLQRQLSTAERVQVFYLNGMVRIEAGDERKAKDMFIRALDVDPEHEESKRQLERLG